MEHPASSLGASVTSLAFASPSASLSFLPGAPAQAEAAMTTADDGQASSAPSVASVDPPSALVSDVSSSASIESDRRPARPLQAQSTIDWGLFASLEASGLPAHSDEGQIKLDTRRSFVVYPPGW